MQAHVDLSTTTQPVPSRVAPGGHRRGGRWSRRPTRWQVSLVLRVTSRYRSCARGFGRYRPSSPS